MTIKSKLKLLTNERLQPKPTSLPKTPRQYPIFNLDIERLKVERDDLNNELNIDRNDLNNVEMAMAQLNRDIDDRMNIVREKERRLMELEKAIGET